MKLTFTLLIAMTLALQVHSQNKIEVQTLEKNMSKGTHTAFIVMIPDSKSQNVEAQWNKYVNTRTVDERVKNFTTQVGNIFKSKEKKTRRDRLKMDKTGDELYIRSVELDKISNYPLDIYAIITQRPEGSQLSAFFQYTDSVFIDPDNTSEERLNSISDFMADFGIEAYRNVVDENIKQAKKEVSKEEGKLKNLQANILRAEKAILRDETLIQEYNTRIAELKSDSVSMIESIETKEKELSAINKDSLEYELVKSDLKSMEREKDRIPREIRSYKGKIRSRELDIKSAKSEIAESELEIKNQEAIIQEKQQVAEELIKEKGEIQ